MYDFLISSKRLCRRQRHQLEGLKEIGDYEQIDREITVERLVAFAKENSKAEGPVEETRAVAAEDLNACPQHISPRMPRASVNGD